MIEAKMTFKNILNNSVTTWLYLLFFLPTAVGFLVFLINVEVYFLQLLQIDLYFFVPWLFWIYSALKFFFGFAYGFYFIPLKAFNMGNINLFGPNKAENGSFIRKLILKGLLAGCITGIGLSGIYELILFAVSEISK